ncbi:MAG: hda [Gammaproteobacteria bacterium]|jgi:DnaA family protein|nr:hda [Gammaproteobacteria bacterium]
MKQQTISFKLPQEKNFENFFTERNQELVHALQSLETVSLYLWGKSQAGCSHLLQAACLYWQQQGWYTLYIDLNQKIDLDLLLAGALEGVQLIAIDHLEQITGQKQLEEKLFHLFNRGLQTPFKMLWGAHHPPKKLKCALADLQSRLASSIIFHVEAPSEADLKRALEYYAKQRGLMLNKEAAQFLLNRIPRQLDKVLSVLDKLDQTSLAEHRRLTIPFLKRFVDHHI